MSFRRNARELNGRANKPMTVGLTGGIASGKTVATNALRAAGFYVVDADEVSRALTAPGSEIEKQLTELFPAANDGGKLNRRKLRDIISADDKARLELNAFMHPLITEELKKQIRQGEPTVICAPLLFESALGALCDETVCVTAPRETRIKRIMARDGVTKEQAAAILDAQIPDFYRATLADYCVPSDTGTETFTAEIVDLFTRIFG